MKTPRHLWECEDGAGPARRQEASHVAAAVSRPNEGRSAQRVPFRIDSHDKMSILTLVCTNLA